MSNQLQNNYQILNVKITRTEIHPADHDCEFQILIHWSGDGKSGTCHFCRHTSEQHQVGEIIASIVQTVGADSWEQLRGKFARVQVPEVILAGQYSGQSRGALAIGHIIDGKWFVTGDILHI